MKYDDLVHKLQHLEHQWRGSSPAPSPTLYPSHSWIRPTRNIQYFACSNATAGKDLPVVVTVGINYTQDPTRIPDQNPHFSKAALPGFPLVEDAVSATYERYCLDHFNYNGNSAVWKQNCLASMRLSHPILPNGQDFHLVMTNLSPWITTKSWASVIYNTNPADSSDLLASPPHWLRTTHPPSSPFDHLDDLWKHLKNEVVLWIGHGLVVVWPHFRLFSHNNQINDWLLTANTASGCLPIILPSKIIKFKRSKKKP